MIHKFMPSVVFGILLCVSGVASTELTTLNVQFTSEPTQYDPLLVEDGVGMRLVANTVGTLYEYDGRGVLTKALVESDSLSRDKKRYTFKFKKGLKWSDGVEFKAEHFILAIQRLVNEPVKSATSQFFPEIDLAKTRALDHRTAEVYLKNADALFLNWCALSALAPIRADMIEGYQKRPDPVVPTLAAYQVVEYKRESHLVLKKNPAYLNKDAVKIDEVKIRFIKDEASLVSLLKSGGVDLLFKVPVLQADELKKFAAVSDVPVEAVTYLGLNTKKAPFNEKKNRQALRDVLFVKKAELARILKTDELPAQTFAPAIMWSNLVSRPVPAKPKSAEKISFEAQSDVGSRSQTILEFVQNELKRELGWKMKLDMIEWKAHYAKIKSDPSAMYRFGWQNPVSDPFLMYQVFQSKSTNNFTGWSNDAYDKLVDQIRQETRLVKKLQLMRQLEDILWDEVPMVPILHQVLKFAYTKRLQGFRSNPFGVVLFRELSLSGSKTD